MCSVLSRLRLPLVYLATGFFFAQSLPASEPNGNVSPKTALGRKLPDFRLTDCFGRELTQAEFASADVLVVAFLGVDCPLAKLYTERLQSIYASYQNRGVKFLGIDANPQDSLSEMAAHARKYKLDFAFAKDKQQAIVDALGATRTPEVFVLDKQRVVQYYGRIDDQYGIGYVRENPTTHDLQIALDSLLDKKAIAVTHQAAPGCLIGRIKQPKAGATVTYSNQIARIFADHCVRCHREGEIGPFSMSEYSEVAGWAEMILEVVQTKRMPPWHANADYGKFANDCSLSEADRDLIARWVEDGAPEGDRSQLPEPKKYVTGWQLPRDPDVVFKVSETPFKVPAKGEVKYQYFRIDPKFSEDKWISCAQLVPGNRTVVHHILAFARPKGEKGGLEAQRGFLVGYVPGSLAEQFPPGMAKRIPADSELIFQVHYTPTGTEQLDQSQLGIIFADPATITHEVKTTSAVQTRLRIPPGDADYKVSAMLPEELPDCELLTMAPHMHLRGKAFRYTAVHANGEREILLDVPAYDFNWQTGYRLSKPLNLTQGSKIFCEASFDNSSTNLNNPNPGQWITWGDQTDDEMMIGYFDIVVARTESGKSPTDSTNRKQMLAEQAIKRGLFERLDKNNDKKIERSEVPARLQDRFEEYDANSDGLLTLEEFERKR